MNRKRRPWLNAVIVLTSLAGLVSVAAEKNDQAPSDFCAYYSKLHYQQPQDPALLGQIPVNATRVFAGDQADRADQVPRPPKPGRSAGGKYADLVVNVAEGRQLGFQPGDGLPAIPPDGQGQVPAQAARRVPARPDVPLLLCPVGRGAARSGSSSTGGMCRTRPAS